MTMTGGQSIIETLRSGGVSTVFGIPGVHNLAIYDALYRSGDIRHVVCRHEQGAGFAADGYARTSGLPGVFITTTGPGATNALTAVGEAWTDSSPLLHLASQIDAHLIDQERGVGHELIDQSGTFKNVTRHSEAVRDLSRISPAVAECLTAIQSGRPRPAYLDFPQDLLNATDDLAVSTPQPAAKSQAGEEEVRLAAERLARAQRPAIVVGAGVHRAGANSEVLELAEALQAPVFETAPGRGAIPNDHPLSVGGRWTGEPRLQECLSTSDGLIAIGTRLAHGDTSGWGMELPPLIHVDAEETMIGKNYAADVALVGDARLVLNQLLDEIERLGAPASSTWPNQVAGLCGQVDAEMRRDHPVPMSVIESLNNALPRDAIVTNDSLIQYWTARHLAVYQPRSFHIPWIFGTLGTALPFAIGAAVAAPERRVVSISGDGAFMFTCAELATAVQEKLNITCLICNDEGYGAMRRHQLGRWGDYTYAVDLATPDFAAMARSFGAVGISLESTDDLEPALRESLTTTGPVVIDMPLALDIPWG